MKIKNIASAGFVITLNDVTFMTDPWIVGLGFYDGWAPLYSVELSDIPQAVDYIWFSHEHPDHFNPKAIAILDKYLNKKPKILFQKTLNGRVAGWLKNKGFEVIEIESHETIFLGDIEVRLEKVGIYDSLLQIRNADFCFTHLNDATIQGETGLKSCRKFAERRFHLATSQYSPANSPCSVADKKCWEREINKKIAYFVQQMRTMKPNICIPSSSAIHFCAEDNLYLNSHRVRPSMFVNNKDLEFTKVILPLPGYEFDFGSNSDFSEVNAKTITFFDDLLNATKEKVFTRREGGSLATLREKLSNANKRVRGNNNMFLLWLANVMGPLNDINFYLSDLGVFIRSSLFSGELREILKPEEFVIISSNVLSRTYDSPYGGDSLLASGRYDLNNCSIKKLSDHLSIIHLNTAGLNIKWSSFFNSGFRAELSRSLNAYINYFFSNRYENF